MLEETSMQKTRSSPLRSMGASPVPICGPDAAKIKKAVDKKSRFCFTRTLLRLIFSNNTFLIFEDDSEKI